MDQLLARHFASQTQVPSLEIALDPPNNAGACTGNLSCVYTHTLSWRSPTQPLPMEWNPHVVFETLFGDSGSTERSARDARLRQRKSLLDSVMEKLTELKQALGPQDQVKVEEYTEAIRDVERRIQKAEEQQDLELPAMAQPQGAPPVFEDHLALMLDLQLLALQSDLTRVVTFMIRQGAERPPLPSNWRARSAPSAVAPRRSSRVDRAHGQDQPLSHAAVLAISGEASRDARR